MRKLTSAILAVLLAAVLAVSAAAHPSISGWVQLLSASDDAAITGVEAADSISDEDISAALDEDNACRFVRGGAEYLSTHPDFNCPTETGFIPDSGAIAAFVFRAESLPVWLLFRAEGETAWTMLAVCDGSTIEASLPGSGTYAVVMGW